MTTRLFRAFLFALLTVYLCAFAQAFPLPYESDVITTLLLDLVVIDTESTDQDLQMQRAIEAYKKGATLVLDVDGTLTPVAGDKQGSLYHRNDVEYLVEEWRWKHHEKLEALAKLLNQQETFVIMSRSPKEKVLRFLTAIGVDETKINEGSRFRKDGWTRSKMGYVLALPSPLVFFDDDAKNLATAEAIPARITSVHCKTWLPDMPGFAQLLK